ncbi:alpha-1-antiproteinase-like isoform X2 [Mustelus asterias]
MLLPVILLLIISSFTGEICAVKKKRHDHLQQVLQSHEQESDMAMVSSANADFAFDLYKEIANHSSSNIFFSPLSISTALAMLSLGTRSATREQLLHGLHFNNMTEERTAKMNRGYKQLLQALMAERNELQLSTGNSLHIQKGNWKEPFDPTVTREAFFNVDKTTKVKVQMMFQNDWFSEISDFHLSSNVIKLPYVGNASMIAILPAEGKLEDVEQNLSREKFEEWLQRLGHRRRRFFLSFPKLSLSVSCELKNILKEMGVRDLFTDDADLFGISTNTSLKVSQVTHKAVLDIDEKSTEAAASTGIKITPMSLPPSITFNKPFLLIIYEENRNNILFLGRIKDPSKKSSP